MSVVPGIQTVPVNGGGTGVGVAVGRGVAVGSGGAVAVGSGVKVGVGSGVLVEVVWSVMQVGNVMKMGEKYV